MRRILKITFLSIIGIVVVGYLGLTCYATIANKGGIRGLPDVPSVSKAAYTVRFHDTGNMILTNDYEQYEDELGYRIFVLHGFYEYTKEGYIYRDMDMVLKERAFGRIDIKKR